MTLGTSIQGCSGMLTPNLISTSERSLKKIGGLATHGTLEAFQVLSLHTEVIDWLRLTNLLMFELHVPCLNIKATVHTFSIVPVINS